MIRVENLTKYYGKLRGVEDISFHVEEGEVLGFLGPNGAGKSTTMRILTGYMPPNSGSAWVANVNVSESPLEAQKNLGYLPENNPLYGDMTVRAYLNFVASMKGMSGAEKEAGIQRVVGSCGLEEVVDRLIGNLSKGYRQRVGLAQAMVNNPPVLILDEPTSGLDPAQIVEIRNLISELKGNRTLILSTHILPEVNMVCDRVVIIHQGHIAAEGALDSLAANMQADSTIRISAIGVTGALSDKMKTVSGVERVELLGTSTGEEAHFAVHAKGGDDIRSDLVAAVFAAEGKLTEIRQVRLTLEDLFVRIVSGEHKHDEETVDEETVNA